MGVNPANLEKLIALAQAPSSGQWETLLDEVVSLFLDASAEYTRDEIKLYGEVLLALLPRVDTQGRRRLAERMSASDNAPRAVLLSLAKDVEKVSAPIFRRAPDLDDATLVGAIRRSPELRALIAGRDALSAAAIDAILKSGDPAALQVLIENRGVPLRPAMLHEIARFARHRPKLQVAMAARDDLPPALADEMFTWVEAEARAALLARGDVDEWSVESVAAGRAKAEAPTPPVQLGGQAQVIGPKTPTKPGVPRNRTRAVAEETGRIRRDGMSKYDQRVWTGPLLIGVSALLVGLVILAAALQSSIS